MTRRERHQRKKRLGLRWLFLLVCGVVLFVVVMIAIEHRTTLRNHFHQKHQEPSTTPLTKQKPLSLLSTKRIAPERKKEELTCPVGWALDSSSLQCARSARGIVEAMIDTNADPCTQLYRHACGKFIDDPQNQGENLLFYSLYQRNREIMQSIIIEHASDQRGDVGVFFHSCVDHLERPLSERSSRSLQELEALVSSMARFDQLPHVMGLLMKYDIPLPITLSFEIDPIRGSTLIPMLSQHLGVFVNSLDDLGTPENLADIQRVTKCSPSDALQITALQRTLLNIREELSPRTSFHSYAAREYNQTHLVRDWTRFVTAVDERGFSLSKMIQVAWPDASSLIKRAWVYSPAYMYRFAELHRSYSLNTWKSYLRYAIHIAFERGARTDPEHHYAYHRSYDGRWTFPWARPNRFYMVAPENPESTEQQCVYATEAYLPLLLDDYYLHGALDKKRTQSASELVETIIETYQTILQNDSSTLFSPHLPRDIAVEKLLNMQVIVGAPAHWQELLQYPDRPIIGSVFLENILQVRRYHRRYLETLFVKHPYQLLEADLLFDGLLHIDNAFYVHQLNTVIINAGILQEPLFSPDDPIEVQYGRLGVVVAHEISHSLDRIGTNFDKQGSIVFPPWMNKELFDRDTHFIVDLYTRQSYLRNFNDGQMTLDENIADQYGLHVAWRALLVQKPDASFETFRLAFAQTYCDAVSRDAEKRMAQKSTHSINSVRVNAGFSTFPCL